ncbi:MAG: hypothetical protein HY922_08560 [Elusimicrobia bacterium]|nr:hypothetical protein [Elusimicrobiota bacterium]
MPEDEPRDAFQDVWIKYEAELTKLNLDEHPPQPGGEQAAAGRALPRGSVPEPSGEEMPLPNVVRERPASEGRLDAAGHRRKVRKSILENAAWPEDMRSARIAYRLALEEIRPLALMPAPQACRCAWAVSEEMLRLLESGNQALLALSAASMADDYRSGHRLNTAVLSLRLSLGLKAEWKRETCLLLGLCALLHDIPAGQAAPKTSDAALPRDSARSTASHADPGGGQGGAVLGGKPVSSPGEGGGSGNAVLGGAGGSPLAGEGEAQGGAVLGGKPVSSPGEGEAQGVDVPGPSGKEESLTLPPDEEGFPGYLWEVKSRLEAVSRLEREGEAPGGRVLGGKPASSPGEDDAVLFSQIIGLCDIFETLSRRRPWGEPMTRHAATKLVIRRHRRKLDVRVLRAFIEQFSLYPPGTIVELSDGAIGRAEGAHPRAPTRPILHIWLDRDRKPAGESALFDLSEHTAVHVVRAMSLADLRDFCGKLARGRGTGKGEEKPEGGKYGEYGALLSRAEEGFP